MGNKLVLFVFLFASLMLGMAACAEHKMPPSSPTGGIGSPTGPAVGPASQGVQG